jgi:hypothetical protein
MIRLLFTIVICAGMNALLPHDSPVGETWIVSGISACELFNGSECEDPACNRNCQFLRRRRLCPIRFKAWHLISGAGLRLRKV